ncbi:hypothetical protein OIU84_002061 [Salix udensis]|uniref:Diacylglycerol O-acyltransferase n=1 Tax=Salix udensis TaxID=889485 RepID=A0AAD6KAG3_9ROSI|nr:hypothetical protein OIU84_002061 [Salix udensis]
MQPSRKAPYQETLVPPVLESVKTKDSAKWETREEMDMADSKESTGSQEPLSPAARLLHAPRFNCTILAAIGCKTNINPGVIKMGLEQTLMKHPRFSKKLVIDDNKCGSKLKWESTAVNVEDHIIEPDLDPCMDSPDQFVEDYISNLSTIPLNLSKPLWEMHILNVKTLDAEAIAVFRIHHSLGDGASLISLLLACTRQTSDPDALPSIPARQRAGSHFSGGVWWLFFAIWTMLRLIWNTLVDLVLFLATMLYLEDTKTPLKGAYGVELKPKRFVHRTVSLDDIKLVKNAMNMTINDAIMGVTQAGLSRYLNRKYGDQSEIEDVENGKKNKIPKNIRLRASVLVNVRPTPGIQLFGAKQASAAMARRVVSNTTLAFSNVVGPVEEISFYGHPVAYIAPSVYGSPHVSSPSKLQQKDSFFYC